MGEAKDLLRRWEETRKATRALAAGIPAGKESHRPAPEVMPLGAMVLHVASAEKTGRDAQTVTPGTWEWKTGIDLEHYPKIADILAVLDRETETTRKFLAGLSDKDLAAKLKLPWGSESTVEDFWLDWILHEVHHRGGLIVGLRVAGVTPPNIWG